MLNSKRIVLLTLTFLMILTFGYSQNEKYNILVVDDSIPQVLLIKEVLKSDNYNIETAFSGKNESSSIKKTLEMGAIDYIIKPINPDILNAKVKNIITYYK